MNCRKTNCGCGTHFHPRAHITLWHTEHIPAITCSPEPLCPPPSICLINRIFVYCLKQKTPPRRRSPSVKSTFLSASLKPTGGSSFRLLVVFTDRPHATFSCCCCCCCCDATRVHRGISRAGRWQVMKEEEPGVGGACRHRQVQSTVSHVTLGFRPRCSRTRY